MRQHIERSIDVPASAEDVWSAIVDPARLGAWLGGVTDLIAVPGAAFTYVDDSGAHHGFVMDVVEERRLQFWWTSEADEGSVVTITVGPGVSGTRVGVTESPASIELGDEAPTRPVGFLPPNLARAV